MMLHRHKRRGAFDAVEAAIIQIADLPMTDFDALSPREGTWWFALWCGLG